MRKIRIKRKDNCYFSYEEKVYRESGKGRGPPSGPAGGKGEG